jgi:hypothetical protein
MNIKKNKFVVLLIFVILACNQKSDKSLKNEKSNKVEVSKSSSKERSNNNDKYILIEQLLSSIVKEQNNLEMFFNFPLKDQNLIYWVEGFRPEVDYSKLNEVSKTFFYENINLFFSENFKKSIDNCKIDVLKKDGKFTYETNLNGNKIKIILEIEHNEFKILYYEEFFDEDDQMKYESTIEYIFLFEDNKLLFKNSNITG